MHSAGTTVGEFFFVFFDIYLDLEERERRKKKKKKEWFSTFEREYFSIYINELTEPTPNRRILGRRNAFNRPMSRDAAREGDREDPD